ncbi:MAG TPA: TfoX/Sxy family protein [Gemmatimonadales bacterium]|jgi:TfoX/Sxy family transcriptional regulator of competence genes|nr:TfoX/Sxy family protein [Gemmatimonadales bacterium]
MIAPSRSALVRDALATLTPVRVKKLFGTDAFFSGERMFAVLGQDALVLRLPEPLRTNTLLGGAARPFLSERLALTHGWVEVPYATELAQLTQLAQAAHAAALRGKKPAKRRFRRAARRRSTA